MEQFFEILYWIAIVGMSVALVAVTALIFVIGFKFMRSNRKGLGVGCIAFSLVAGGMIVLMLNKTFFLPA